MSWDIETFCKKLPKIELHAHLNGSLSPDTLRKLHKMKLGSSDENFVVPDITEMKNLEECFKVFGIAHSLTNTPDAVRLATRDVVREFAEDGVVYLELRTTPRDLGRAMSREEYVKAVATEATLAGAEHGIVVKVLLSADRAQGVLAAEMTRALALAASRRFDSVVLGVDLSGDPNRGSAQTFVPTLAAARRDGLRVVAHCAEVENEEETVALLESGVAERLGHCTHAAPPPPPPSPDAETTAAAAAAAAVDTAVAEGDAPPGRAWAMLRASGVPVEACLSSNVRCGTVASFALHHFGALRAHGHPVVLCTDDKGVFGTTLSNEYRLAAEHFSLSREDLWKLSFDGIEHSFASAEEKEQLRHTLLEWKKNNIHEFIP